MPGRPMFTPVPSRTTTSAAWHRTRPQVANNGAILGDNSGAPATDFVDNSLARARHQPVSSSLPEGAVGARRMGSDPGPAHGAPARATRLEPDATAGSEETVDALVATSAATVPRQFSHRFLRAFRARRRAVGVPDDSGSGPRAR